MFFIVLHSVLVHLLSLSLAFLKKKKWKEVYEKNKKTKTKKKSKKKHTIEITKVLTNERGNGF